MARNISKKGQTGSHSAILVIIITVLMVLFILFLPPEDRADLLGDENSDDEEGTSTNDVLLKESPGFLKYINSQDKEFTLSGFKVSAIKQGTLLTSRNQAYIKNSVFQKQEYTINFDVNPDLTENIIISFNIEKLEGNIIVHFNDALVYEASPEPGSGAPILIDSSLIKPQNTITFSTNPPGLTFWRYNEYNLKDVKVFADVLDLTLNNNQQTISLTEDETNMMKTAQLLFLPVCQTTQIEKFEIKINGYTAFSGVPDCELFNRINIPTEDLYAGNNEIQINIGEGTILIERPAIIIKFNDEKPLTYYFEVEENDFFEDELITNDEYNLEMNFPNNDYKRFELIINGRLMGFNTARVKEQRLINQYLQPGTNSIQIKPLTDMTLTQIRITK